MKKFAFRLDSALKWRNTQLQLERAKLSNSLHDEARLKSELAAIGDRRREAVACLQGAERFETVELRALSAFLIGASARENELHQLIARRQHTIQYQRTQVLAAERNLRLLEKLREKRLEEWTAEFHKQIDAAAEEAWLAANFRQPTQIRSS